jgi:hypothetical protein
MDELAGPEVDRAASRTLSPEAAEVRLYVIRRCTRA